MTLAFCQDVQAEAYDWPASFFEPALWRPRRQPPDPDELATAVAALSGADRPVIIAGGGVHYSEATEALRAVAERHNIPVAETQAGKSALPWDHPLNLGAIGVTGSSAANAVAENADIVLAVGTRLQDFTTGSWALFKHPKGRLIGLNVAAYDAGKHRALPLVCDAGTGLQALSGALGNWRSTHDVGSLISTWNGEVDAVTAAPTGNTLPTDMQVIGAVQRSVDDDTILVCAAGGLPGELHKLWRAARPNGYHLEYGYSCMGYEIAGGLGVKMARPDREVVVMVGDGSYLMLNSELATAVMLGQKLIVVLADNRGFGCINRLQMATGGANFNNLLRDARHARMPEVDFAAHMAALGATTEHVGSVAELEAAMARARAAEGCYGIVIDTDPIPTTEAGGHWWDVAVPEVSDREQVQEARAAYVAARTQQRPGE